MKYKKHIATGALALSLLVSGSSVFAFTPQDLGIKDSQPTYQRHNKNKSVPIRRRGKRETVGTVATISDAGFTLEVKNMKHKISSSVDVRTDKKTTYTKNGKVITISDLAIGQKVVVVGKFDKATNILTAQKVKLVIN